MNEIGDTIEAVDIAAIMKSLPHRYPFLMVDRIVSIRGDEFAIGIKNVTYNEPQFLGHFPGNPVFPGVLMIEGMAQTAGVICMHAIGWQDRKTLVYFLTIDQAKFRKPVVPGDILLIEAELIRAKGSVGKANCRCIVNGEVVSEGVLMFAFVLQ